MRVMAGLGDGLGDGGGSGGGGGGSAGGGTAGGSTGGTGGSGAAGSGGSGAGSGAAGGGSGGSGTGAGAAGLGSGSTGATASWRDTLPDELKADPTLSKYSDIPNLAKAHIELQKKFGEKGIFKPKEGASKEEIQAFREALGIPTDPAKYDMGKFEGVEIPQATVQWAQKLGAEHGIEPAAMKTLMTEYFKLDAQSAAAQKAQAESQMKEGLKGLKTKWGDAYDQNIQKANFAAEKVGGKPFVEALVKAGIHNDPTILETLVGVAKLFSDDTLREGGVSQGRVTPAELDGKIASVQSQLFRLKPTDGAYKEKMAELESLWKQKTGGK